MPHKEEVILCIENMSFVPRHRADSAKKVTNIPFLVVPCAVVILFMNALLAESASWKGMRSIAASVESPLSRLLIRKGKIRAAAHSTVVHFHLWARPLVVSGSAIQALLLKRPEIDAAP